MHGRGPGDDMNKAEELTVKHCAERAGVEPHVLRYYVRIGLLRPGRVARNGYKMFSRGDVVRLRFIRVAQALGCPLEEIRAVLAAAMSGSRACPQVQRLLETRAVLGRRRLQDMERFDTRLQRIVASWERLPAGAPDGNAVRKLIESLGSNRA